MSTRREFLLTSASLMGASVAGPAGMTNAFAQQAAPNMPARNPWLADGVYPTSHFNPEATDSVLHAGPAKRKRLTRDKDVKVVSNVMVSNPALKKVGTDTAAAAPGAVLDRIVHGHAATTNIAFGGDDWKTLYFTSRSSLFSVNLKVAGVTVPVAAKKA